MERQAPRDRAIQPTSRRRRPHTFDALLGSPSMVHGVASRWMTLRGWSYRRLLIRASISYNRCYFLWWLQMIFGVVGGWGWSGFWGGWSGVKVSDF